MTTKTCEKCGYTTGIRDPQKRCPVCNTRFRYGICSCCGEPSRFYHPHGCMCKFCYDTTCRQPNADAEAKDRRRAEYQAWLDKIKLIPKDYPTLTEEQWLEAVKYFNGCAMCGDESIDARQYFIPFEYGGKYCDWNVLPVCSKCATRTGGRADFNYNYFLKRPKLPGLPKIIKYLGDKIDGALARSTEEPK